MDGRVILEGVPSNAILVVSYIGYVSQEIPLKSSQTNVRIQLVEDTQALDEVVVVGIWYAIEEGHYEEYKQEKLERMAAGPKD